MKDINHYNGKWKIYEDEESVGTLVVNEEKGGMYLIIKLPSKGSSINHKMTVTYKDIINGKLDNEGEVALINCAYFTRHDYIGSHSDLYYSVDAVYWGKYFEKIEDAYTDRAFFRLSNAVEWSGLCKLISEYKDKHVKFKWEEKGDIKYTYRNGDMLTVTPMISKYSSETSKQEIKITQDVNFEFKSKERISIFEFEERLNTISELIPFATGYATAIKSSHVIFSETSNMEYSTPFEVILNRKTVDESQDISQYKLVFTLLELKEKNLMSNWIEKYERLKPVIDLYLVPVKYNDMSVEMVFLNSVQALETYHARFVCNSRKNYHTRVLNKIVSWKESPNYDHLYDELFSKAKGLEKSDSITLLERLYDLFVADLNFPLRQYIGVYPVKFCKQVKDTRNYLTHYGEKDKDKAFSTVETGLAIAVLRKLISYYILHEIGFDNEFCEKKNTKDREGFDFHVSILKESNKLKEDSVFK
ncbi:MAG TPA: HEPN domain-containing protein [Clostridium sp.]|uniref:ApeA N-terminal domain 1-containing protein n=1 Tax=Clostridium sp. TaxID=1506 RepID=UPI002F93BD80